VPKRRSRKRRTASRLAGYLLALPVLALLGLLWNEFQRGSFWLLTVALLILLAVLGLRLRGVLARRRRARTLAELLQLTPTQFEQAIADLLRDLGYRDISRLGGAGDLAADIICRDQQGRRVVVQCKRYRPGSRIGSPAIQHFIGMQTVHHQADYGIFVTSSEYTRAAVELATRHGIVLFDGADLSRLMQQVRG
jgi:restriction system protein